MWGGVYKNPNNYYYGLALMYDSPTNSFSKKSGNNPGSTNDDLVDILYF